MLVALLTLAFIGAGPGRLQAQEHESESGESSQHHAGHHKNHVAVFVGAIDEHEETAFSLGLDYERRLSRVFGIGVLTHYAFGDVRSFALAAPIFLHATERLKFSLAAGYEDANHEDRETLIRLGVEYGFEVGRLTMAPMFAVDFVEDEEILVLGVNIGRGF